MRTFMGDDLDRFAADLVGRTFGGVRIVEAVAFLDEDSSGEVGTFLSLTLDDPVGETWPVDDIFDLRHDLRDEARRAGLRGPLHFDLRPLSPELLGDDDADPAEG